MARQISGVIRHVQSGQYYAGGGQWTTHADAAVTFHNLWEVVAEAEKHALRGCSEFVVSLAESPGASISLPV